MAHVEVHDDRSLESPVLIEGLPGVGLVGKIATDHLIDTFDMSYYAACRCEGLPNVAVYHEGDPGVQPPVRIYADHERDLLALQSDVPVSPSEATEFAACLSGWIAEQDALPLYLSGIPAERDDPPELHGIATGEADSLLSEHDVSPPPQGGLVSGPTGNLLSRAERDGLDSLGFVVESNAQFPDPEAARKLLLDAIEPVAGIDVDTQKLVDQAEEIAQARQQLAQQMGQAGEESSQAQPIGFQ
ncbi:MAG: proteasome assembly chaperone family protein [Halorientalis sp.]